METVMTYFAKSNKINGEQPTVYEHLRDVSDKVGEYTHTFTSVSIDILREIKYNALEQTDFLSVTSKQSRN